MAPSLSPSGRLLLGMAVPILLTSCSDPAAVRGVAGDPSPHAHVAAAVQAPRITVTPADGEESVRLDAAIRVRVTGGTLTSVDVHHADDRNRVVLGHMALDSLSWSSAETLDNHIRYIVDAKAVAPDGTATSSLTSFTTMFVTRLTTSMTPGDGDVVGVGMPISLRFNTAIPPQNQRSLLQHITVETAPHVVGDWHWFTQKDVHWRPRDFWPPNTRVTVTGRLRGVEAGGGAWGFGDFTTSFSIAPEKHLSIVDVASHQMQVFQNNVLVQQWPISAGRDKLPTLGGTLDVPYKTRDVLMDSQTIGIPRWSPDGYYEHVFWNVAISVDGFYIHAAPWSVGQQGTANVSHGCVNLAPDRAQTFFNFSRIGDVVQVINSPRAADYGDGEGDWQIPYPQWANSGGSIEATPNPTHVAGGI